MTFLRDLRRGDVIRIGEEDHEVECRPAVSKSYGKAVVSLISPDLNVYLYTGSYEESINRVKEGPVDE